MKYAIVLFALVTNPLLSALLAQGNLSFEIESAGRLQFAGIYAPHEWRETSEGILEVPAYVYGCPVAYVKGRACISNQNVKSIKFGSSLQNIGSWSFANCSNLTEICFAESPLGNGRQVRISSFAFANASGLRSVKFPSSLVSIGSNAFMGCDNLSSIILPAGVVTVSDGAFSHCGSLGSVYIPATVEMMDDAFSIFTPNLRAFELSDSNPYYLKENDAIYSRERNELVLYPRITTNKIAKIRNGTEWVRAFSFFQCSGIESVEFPDTISVICEGAFGCSTVKSVVLPAHLNTISDRAFAECTNLTEVALHSQLKYIGEDAFGGCRKLQRVEVYAKPFDVAFNKQFPDNAVFFAHGYYDEWLQFSAKTGRRIETVLDPNLRK